MLGVSFAITADADQSYLDGLLEKFRAFVDQTRVNTGLEDPLKLAILSGFLLCDEAEKLKNFAAAPQMLPVSVHDAEEAEKLTLKLISLIDRELGV
jgi:hypothetical protein